MEKQSRLLRAIVFVCFLMSGNASAGLSVEAHGVTKSFRALQEDLANCMSRSSRPRDEYESRQEYEARLARGRGSCDRYSTVANAVVTAPVKLQYNADREEFTLILPTGTREFALDYTPLFGSPFAQARFSAGRGKSGGYSSMSVLRGCQINRPFWRENETKRCSKQPSLNDRFFFQGSIEARCSGTYVTDQISTNAMCDAFVAEGSKWTLEKIELGPLEVKLSSPVQSARRLRASEEGLLFRLSGTVDVRGGVARIGGVTMINTETGEILFRAE